VNPTFRMPNPLSGLYGIVSYSHEQTYHIVLRIQSIPRLVLAPQHSWQEGTSYEYEWRSKCQKFVPAPIHTKKAVEFRKGSRFGFLKGRKSTVMSSFENRHTFALHCKYANMQYVHGFEDAARLSFPSISTSALCQ
jgi:hypothetical protein